MNKRALVEEWNTVAECWKRRQEVCIGYSVSFDHATRTTTVKVFAVQDRRTSAPLGELQMKEAEWTVFHKLVHRRWEDLDYPRCDDMESGVDE